MRAINGRPEYVRSACDAPLKRLGVDRIALYYQRRVDNVRHRISPRFDAGNIPWSRPTSRPSPRRANYRDGARLGALVVSVKR